MKRNSSFIQTRCGSSFNEANDCTVRALALAGNISYKKAHDIADKKGRINGKRFSALLLLSESKKYGLKWKIIKEDIGKYVSTFAKNHLTGRYIVLTRGHAVAVIDGKIRDTFDCSKKRVGVSYKLIE